jgi:hypothetical protein
MDEQDGADGALAGGPCTGQQLYAHIDRYEFAVLKKIHGPKI